MNRRPSLAGRIASIVSQPQVGRTSGDTGTALYSTRDHLPRLDRHVVHVELPARRVRGKSMCGEGLRACRLPSGSPNEGRLNNAHRNNWASSPPRTHLRLCGFDCRRTRPVRGAYQVCLAAAKACAPGPASGTPGDSVHGEHGSILEGWVGGGIRGVNRRPMTPCSAGRRPTPVNNQGRGCETRSVLSWQFSRPFSLSS